MNNTVNRTLILIDNNRNGFFCNNYTKVDIREIYKTNDIFSRIMRRILFKYKIPLYSYYLGEWYASKTQYDLVILFDTGNAKYLIPIIHERYPSARLVIWFWNPVRKTINPFDLKFDYVELWSFDPGDCEDFNMKYNTQFFIYDNIKNLQIGSSDKMVCTAFFVGAEKGRLSELIELKKLFEQNSVKFICYIVGKNNKKIPELNISYKNPISYRQVLEFDCRADVIIDIVSQGQTGLTLRPLESLYLKKKLVTNMKQIVNHRLYNANNVFIIGKDPMENFKDFIDSPYVEYEYDNLVKYYSFPLWIKRFYE